MAGFQDKIAIVTGGASGIGRALCQELGRRGAIVIVADIDADGAKNTASAIVEAGGRSTGAPVDTASAEQVQQLVQETVAAHGRLDLIFNNAGIALNGEVLDMNLEHWRRMVEINLMGVVHGTI